LDDYGAVLLNAAMEAALAKGVPHPNAVRKSLEKNRQACHLPPPIGVTLSDKRVRELVIRPHRLESYDQLSEGNHDQ